MRNFLSALLALIGIGLALISIEFTAIQGAQIAIIGACFLLLALYLKPGDR